MSAKKKTVILTNYIQGLCSFLDSEKIQWELLNESRHIKIYYKNEEELLLLGYRFGKFYLKNS